MKDIITSVNPGDVYKDSDYLEGREQERVSAYDGEDIPRFDRKVALERRLHFYSALAVAALLSFCVVFGMLAYFGYW